MLSTPRSKLLLLGIATLGVGGGIFAWKSQPAPPPVIPAPAKTAARPPTAPASPAIAALTDAAQPWQIRIDQLRASLAGECSERDVRSLYLTLTTGPTTAELPEDWYVIANDIMQQLFLRDTDPQRLATYFTQLLQDSQQPLVLRDYAVQHLSTWLIRKPDANKPVSKKRPLHVPPTPEITALVLQTLTAAATASDPALSDSTIPGTTLMMLVHLRRTQADVDCLPAIATLRPWLENALQDTSLLTLSTRVSAVQAASVLAPDHFLPAIRRLAYSENDASALRLPAIASLAACGHLDDLPLLREIARKSPALAYAANDAHLVLTKKLTPKP